MIQSASTSALRAEYLRRLADKPYFAVNLGTHLNLFGQHPASGWAVSYTHLTLPTNSLV